MSVRIFVLAFLATLVGGCWFSRSVSPFPEGEKPVFLWLDATANLDRIGSVEGLTEVLDWCQEAGVDGVVVDIRPISGHVLFPSELFPRLERWPMRGNPEAMWEYDPDFNLLAEACRLGHERGLIVYASMNVFAGGNKWVVDSLGEDAGLVYGQYPVWQAWDSFMIDDEIDVYPTTEHGGSYTAFLSPHHPGVRAALLALIQEVVEKHDIDGLVLDRVRYDNYYGDFSIWALTAFESHLGRKVQHWPEDVYVRTGPASDDLEPGPLWDEWRLFRAQTIHDFMVEAGDHIHRANPDCAFGDYVGAWYPIYDEVGVNWASPRNRAHLDRFPDGYERTGYADELDVLFTGNYFTAVTPAEISSHPRGFIGDWLSVQGSADLADEVVHGECPVIGGLYVEQYVADGQFDAEQFSRAMRAAFDHSDGLMIFDLVHIANFDAWDTVAAFLAEN